MCCTVELTQEFFILSKNTSASLSRPPRLSRATLPINQLTWSRWQYERQPRDDSTNKHTSPTSSAIFWYQTNFHIRFTALVQLQFNLHSGATAHENSINIIHTCGSHWHFFLVQVLEHRKSDMTPSALSIVVEHNRWTSEGTQLLSSGGTDSVAESRAESANWPCSSKMPFGIFLSTFVTTAFLWCLTLRQVQEQQQHNTVRGREEDTHSHSRVYSCSHHRKKYRWHNQTRVKKQNTAKLKVDVKSHLTIGKRGCSFSSEEQVYWERYSHH